MTVSSLGACTTERLYRPHSVSMLLVNVWTTQGLFGPKEPSSVPPPPLTRNLYHEHALLLTREGAPGVISVNNSRCANSPIVATVRDIWALGSAASQTGAKTNTHKMGKGAP